MSAGPYAEMACSIARTLEIAGERWTLLILRDIYLGLRRFDEIQGNLGISRKVLSERLRGLLASGLLERRPYMTRPPRNEYLLTEKGRELAPVLMALMAWGDRWTAGAEGPPMRLRHDRCGQLTTPLVTCSECGLPLRADGVTMLPGPGGRAGPGTWEIAPLLKDRS